MGKHTLQVEYDYDFVLIGISSHEKDYRICWALNKQLEIELTKVDSLEIKGKKDNTPSFFSLYKYDNSEEFKEYSVLANLSESKSSEGKMLTLFDDETTSSNASKNEWLIPEHKQMNYFFVIKGEVDEYDVDKIAQKIQKIDLVQAVVKINANQLKTKQNLIY